jgi:hypothetical protein
MVDCHFSTSWLMSPYICCNLTFGWVSLRGVELGIGMLGYIRLGIVKLGWVRLC